MKLSLAFLMLTLQAAVWAENPDSCLGLEALKELEQRDSGNLKQYLALEQFASHIAPYKSLVSSLPVLENAVEAALFQDYYARASKVSDEQGLGSAIEELIQIDKAKLVDTEVEEYLALKNRYEACRADFATAEFEVTQAAFRPSEISYPILYPAIPYALIQMQPAPAPTALPSLCQFLWTSPQTLLPSNVLSPECLNEIQRRFGIMP
jgi:hypothetical protein